jgi:hypothetical protein
MPDAAHFRHRKIGKTRAVNRGCDRSIDAQSRSAIFWTASDCLRLSERKQLSQFRIDAAKSYLKLEFGHCDSCVSRDGRFFNSCDVHDRQPRKLVGYPAVRNGHDCHKVTEQNAIGMFDPIPRIVVHVNRERLKRAALKQLP